MFVFQRAPHALISLHFWQEGRRAAGRRCRQPPERRGWLKFPRDCR